MEAQGELIPNEEGQAKPGRKMSREELTVTDGTSLDVAVSSLIKELRRGNEWEALYWARELEQRYYRYLWRRLLIFCGEDVGLANPDAIVQVVALREAYMITKEESQRDRGDYNCVAMAVFLLARSPKSKEAGFAHMLQHQAIHEKGWRATPPEYAVDQHTAEGRRRLGAERGRHWFTNAQVVTNRAGGMDYELYWAREDARRGVWTHRSIEVWASEMNDRGMLEFGLEGMPWLVDPRVDPNTGEVIEEDGPEAIDMIPDVYGW